VALRVGVSVGVAVGVRVLVGVRVAVGVRVGVGVLVSVGVRDAVGVRVGVRVGVGVLVLVGVRDAVGVRVGVGVRLGVRVSVGVGVRLGVTDGVDDVAVTLGTGADASKRISAPKSAAVTCPSRFTSACPFTPACEQPTSVPPKISVATADRSAASTTLSQLASPGGNWAAAVDAHASQHAAAQRATGRIKPRAPAEIIRQLQQVSNAPLTGDLQYDPCATYANRSITLLQAAL
jgi:hypothetical protein